VGISISLEAKLPSSGLFSFSKKKIDWEVETLLIMTETMQEYGLAAFVPKPPVDHNGRLPLHFCEEWGDIKIENGKFLLGIRTSNCGPGYHAMVCAAVDALEKKHGLKFYETDIDEDETGYFRSHDFEALQTYFANWLPNLAESVEESLIGGNTLRLQMPLDQIAPDGNAGEVLTPSGPRTAAYMKSLTEMNSSQQREAAEKWFPWWNARPKAADFLKMSESMMWVDVPWHAAENSWENQVYMAALSGLRQSKLLGGDVSHLQQELNELDQYLGQEENKEYPPSPIGIGYRRQICRWPLTPSWTGLLPGYLREISSEDNYQLFCDDFVVRLTSLLVEKNDDELLDLGSESERSIIARGAKENFSWRIEREEGAHEDGWLTSLVLAGSRSSILIAAFTHNASFDLSDLTAFAEGLAISDH
jgi:hypothetical protein